jgi:hypothetical protein
MTERRTMEPFERQFTDRVRAYTDVATDRRIDTLEVARTAMSSRRASGWSQRRLGTDYLGQRFAGVRWAAVAGIVVLIGVTGVAVLGRPSDFGIGSQPTPGMSSTPTPAPTPGGPILDVLRHSWLRPIAVEPGLHQWGSGFLVLGSGLMDFGPEPGAGASRSAITAAGFDILLVTATRETQGCAIGELGTYRWSLKGNGTVLTLTAVSPDACAARETALAGDWVRSDFPPRIDGEISLAPGTHLTSSFDPFGNPAAPVRVSYTVPDGWKVVDDQTAVFVLNRPPGPPTSQPSAAMFIALLVQPRMAADFTTGQACVPGDDAPGVGRGLPDLVAAIVARPGVVSTPPTAVTIGGHPGKLLDLRLAKSWTGSCTAPEGPVVGLPILNGGGPAPGQPVGISRDHPVRLILLDLGSERTMAVVIFDFEPSQPDQFQQQVARVMPIIESFKFQPLTP